MTRIISLIMPLCVIYLLQRLLSIHTSGWRRLVLYLGCYGLVNTIIYIGDPVNLPPAFIIFIAAVQLGCNGGRLQRFSVALVLSAIAFPINTIADNTRYFGDRNFFCIVVWCGLLRVCRKALSADGVELSARLWWMVDLLTLAPLCTVFITVLIGDQNIFSLSLKECLLNIVSFFSAVGLLRAVTVLARQQRLEQELTLSRLNQAYYQNLEQEQQQVRRLRHDMNNHLQMMSSLPDLELRSYLESLLQTPAMETTGRFCENSVANAVLAAKCQRMERADIQWDFEVSLPQTLPVDHVDLCAIFANSLDNAIEACEKLPAAQRRISVRARAEKGLFVLRVQNAAEVTSATGRDGNFSTTKANAKEHGYGLSSIREIAHRYGGSVELSTAEHQFVLLLYLPLAPADSV